MSASTLPRSGSSILLAPSVELQATSDQLLLPRGEALTNFRMVDGAVNISAHLPPSFLDQPFFYLGGVAGVRIGVDLHATVRTEVGAGVLGGLVVDLSAIRAFLCV